MKTRAAFLGLLLLFGVGTFGVGNASAQAKKKFVSKPGTSKYTQTHIIDVGDVPNHQLRLFELHTVYTGDAPDFDGVKVKERFARPVSDYIEGSGAAAGYAVNILENGDKIFERLAIQAQTTVAADGSRKLGYRSVMT